MTDPQSVTATFTQRVGHAPDGVWAGPGRVNLIGEHTDYNNGFVLPFALEQRALVAVSKRDDQRLTAYSVEMSADNTAKVDTLTPAADRTDGKSGWWDYLWGVVWSLRQAGHPVGGLDVVLSSNVPLGAGLSSSAALECAMMAAICDLYNLDIAPMERVHLARKAENDFVGAPTGILDQAAATLCEQDNALFLDCQDLSTRQVPLKLGEYDLELLVLDTKTTHSHVDGEYVDRRRTCEKAAAMLGVDSLRDVTDVDQAAAQLIAEGANETVVKRMRHVVTENLRVLAAVASADADRLPDLGELMNASEDSMRDDFEITVPQIDLACKTARDAGAVGARMTGGGFGGCIIALHRKGKGDEIGQAVATAFKAAGYNQPEWFNAVPSAGARRVDGGSA